MKNHPGRWLAPMIVALALASPNPAIAASPGGVGPDSGTPPAETAPTESGCATEASGVSSTAACAPAKKARLVGGEAIAPAGAPAGVRAAIAAANKFPHQALRVGRWSPQVGLIAAMTSRGLSALLLRGGKLLTSPLDCDLV